MFASWKKSENAASTRRLRRDVERRRPSSSSSAWSPPVARVAGERADALLEREERLALLLDEHLPEQVAEEVDVGTQRLVRGGLSRHRLQFYALSDGERRE